jgi:hypothetical protein
MSDATAIRPDPGCCPLCGGDNRCAMEQARASGEPQPPCWCVAQTFSPALLARLPAGSQHTACICARCVADDAAGGDA